MSAARATQPGNITPDFHAIDYAKFFGAGALAACGTHGVGLSKRSNKCDVWLMYFVDGDANRRRQDSHTGR